MRWIAVLSLLLSLAGGLRAAGSDDQYLEIYNQILQADSLQQAGQLPAAALQYRNALAALQKFHDEHPDWNPTVMSFRLNDLGEKAKSLAQYLPGTNTTTAIVAQTNAAPPNPLADLQAQVQGLTAANARLQMKLNEALSVQPAAVAPGELAKAEEKNMQLQRTNALLVVALDQLKAANSAGESTQAQKNVADLKNELAATQKKMADTMAELNRLKASPPASENVKQLTAENGRLKKELDRVSRELADREAHPPKAPAAVSTAETDRLRARLAVLEATAVPYTPEELAVINAAPKTQPAAPLAVAPVPVRITHSVKDLPPGVGPLMEQAQRAAREKDFTQAEKSFQEVLLQAPDNALVLVNLGNVQFEMAHLDDCEKNVQRALALDPQYPDALYLLGILRYRQEKLEEALDALSRSASLNATNANAQYALGRVLSDKGMMPAAETAFRKTLQMAPDYADAHYGLALCYAVEKPPSPALAQWHYQKALELGHPKNANLEKLLAGDK